MHNARCTKYNTEASAFDSALSERGARSRIQFLNCAFCIVHCAFRRCIPPPSEKVSTMHKVVLLRHGESTWNKENRFTGWTDVDLSEKGREEARDAGRLMAAEKFEFDVTYTSLLKRAIRTC